MKLSSRYLFALADMKQIPGLFKGSFLKGFREPRIAFVGRSNVGKSSLINAVMGATLAHKSKQPGKTRAVQFYFWAEGKKIIADLPGYGFAKVSQSEKQDWANFIQSYFETDPNLERIVFLMDSRHGPTSLDFEAMEFLRLKNIPVTLVFTKVDKLKTQSLKLNRIRESKAALSKSGFRLQSEPLFVSCMLGRSDGSIKNLRTILSAAAASGDRENEFFEGESDV